MSTLGVVGGRSRPQYKHCKIERGRSNLLQGPTEEIKYCNNCCGGRNALYKVTGVRSPLARETPEEHWTVEEYLKGKVQAARIS